MEEQKVKNPIDIIAAFNRVLGNPAKITTTSVLPRANATKKTRSKAIIAQGGTATPDYNNAHIEGLNSLGKIVFPQ